MRNTAMVSPPFGGWEKCSFLGERRYLCRPDTPERKTYKRRPSGWLWKKHGGLPLLETVEAPNAHKLLLRNRNLCTNERKEIILAIGFIPMAKIISLRIKDLNQLFII